VGGVRRLPLAIAFVSLLSVLAWAPPEFAHATAARWVVDENAKPGTRAWKIPDSAPDDIQGYADKVSVDGQGRVTF
jgi:hypothetical protein